MFKVRKSLVECAVVDTSNGVDLDQLGQLAVATASDQTAVGHQLVRTRSQGQNGADQIITMDHRDVGFGMDPEEGLLLLRWTIQQTTLLCHITGEATLKQVVLVEDSQNEGGLV